MGVYVDGEKVNEMKLTNPDFTKAHNNGAIWLARWKAAAGWDFKGVIDEVAIFNVPLSDDEINDLMNSGLDETLSVSGAGKIIATWGSLKEI